MDRYSHTSSDQAESEAVYTEAYHASRRATRAVMALKACGNPGCATCKAISIVRSNENVRCCLAGRPYKTNHELPVSHGLSDNTDTYQNFLKNCLGLLAALCQTHVTAIPACNGTHKKYFDNTDIYEEFYRTRFCTSLCKYPSRKLASTSRTYLFTG